MIILNYITKIVLDFIFRINWNLVLSKSKVFKHIKKIINYNQRSSYLNLKQVKNKVVPSKTIFLPIIWFLIQLWYVFRAHTINDVFRKANNLHFSNKSKSHYLFAATSSICTTVTLT